MIYAFTNTDSYSLTAESQREIISLWCNGQNLRVDKWFSAPFLEEGLINEFSFGDTLILSDISKADKNYASAVRCISALLKKNVRIISAENGQEYFGEILGEAFETVLSVESRFLSEKTRAGLNEARKNGQKFGRKTGQKMDKVKLSGKEEEIRSAISKGGSIRGLSKAYGVSWITMKRFVSEKL